MSSMGGSAPFSTVIDGQVAVALVRPLQFAQFFRASAQCSADFPKFRTAIDLRLPFTQQIEVWAVENIDDFLGSLPVGVGHPDSAFR